MSFQAVETKVTRTVGGTESSWCRAVRGGTGIAVLALLITKSPDISLLQNALHKLQNSHPILRSRLHNPNTEGTTSTFSFAASPTPFVKIESHTLTTSSEILGRNGNDTVSPFHKILEHELNRNTWQDNNNNNPAAKQNTAAAVTGSDILAASIYQMPDATTWVVAMRLHVAACDRTTAVSLLRELLVLIKEEEEGAVTVTENNKGEVNLAIEDLVPGGKAKKPIWTRGLNMLSYSVNSLRLTNLKFNDTKSERFSQVVRMQLNHTDTNRVLAVSPSVCLYS